MGDGRLVVVELLALLALLLYHTAHEAGREDE